MTDLDDALDLIPEAWHDDIADDATSQGCSLGYAAGTGGLRTATIERVQQHFAEREDDADWQALSQGQQLDDCFAAYNGIGWPTSWGSLRSTPPRPPTDRCAVRRTPKTPAPAYGAGVNSFDSACDLHLLTE